MRRASPIGLSRRGQGVGVDHGKRYNIGIGGPLMPFTFDRRRMPSSRVASACFTLFIAAALAQESAPTSPPVDASGWASLKWGMTLQQAREAMPELQQLASPTEDQFMLTRLEAKQVQLGRVTADASVQFYPDKDYLGAVKLVVDDSSSRLRAGRFALLKEGLTERYGKPTSEDQSSVSHASGDVSVKQTILWRLKSSTIRLQSYGYDNAGYVQVRYAERKPDNTL